MDIVINHNHGGAEKPTLRCMGTLFYRPHSLILIQFTYFNYCYIFNYIQSNIVENGDPHSYFNSCPENNELYSVECGVYPRATYVDIEYFTQLT